MASKKIIPVFVNIYYVFLKYRRKTRENSFLLVEKFFDEICAAMFVDFVNENLSLFDNMEIA